MTDVRFVEKKGMVEREEECGKRRDGHRGGKSTLIWSGKIEGWRSLYMSSKPLGTYIRK